MNIHSLKNGIKSLKSVPISFTNNSRELLFTHAVKEVVKETNFELIGEELCIKNEQGTGKCDLWLANCSHNFLLSLELKVGDSRDTRKQKSLQRQVLKYTDHMQYYFPNNIIYGFGAYKLISSGVDFFDYQACFEKIQRGRDIEKTIFNKEIDNLKLLISTL